MLITVSQHGVQSNGEGGCTQYYEGTEEDAVNSSWRRLKIKAKFELDIISREMHSDKVVRSLALLPYQPELKFLLNYLFC